jgi:hypothetical protein
MRAQLGLPSLASYRRAPGRVTCSAMQLVFVLDNIKGQHKFALAAVKAGV